jgi:hypothetical protein
VIEELLKK